MRLFTIGFTKKRAEDFFSLLQQHQVRHVLDVRLNNRSQLAGFSKADDLPYFLKRIAGMTYRHAPEMAPTQEMLNAYKRPGGSWEQYEQEFNALLEARRLITHVTPTELADACLLCSEDQPEHCHRRLVAEYLQHHIPQLDIVHLH